MLPRSPFAGSLPPRLSRRTLLLLAALAAPLSGAGAGAGADSATPFAEPSPGVDDAPVPVTFPRDDGPHDAKLEWWYYTGHLRTADDRAYGFEFVVFKGQQGVLNGYASHFAITDSATKSFHYDQRLILAPPTARDAADRFDLTVDAWRLQGGGGSDALVAAMPGYGLDVTLESRKPPALHDGDGYIAYGSGEASYYYSRTRMAVAGSLTLDGVAQPVTGEAWFDHQWGNFATYQKGGWDWFSVQLENQTDLMLYVIRAPDGSPLIVDGSVVAPDGAVTVLDRGDFTTSPTGSWTSPATGVVYPSGWTVALPKQKIELTLTPSQADQELDVRKSTRNIYWEGEVAVAGTMDGAPVAGLGYVELTGYTSTKP